MKEFNNSIAFILFLINLIGSIGILVAGFYYPDCPFYIKKEEDDFSTNSHINLTININQNTNNLEENFKNLSYFEKYKEIKLAKNEEEDSTITKELNLGIYINFLTIYFCMYLCLSFFIKEIDCPECDCSKFFENLEDNKFLFYICFPCYSIYYCCICFSNFCEMFCECCDDCCKDCKCNCECKGSDCNCQGGGEGLAGLGLILCAVLVAIVVIAVAAAIIAGFFYLIFFLTNLCGKNIARYVSFIINAIVNIIVFGLAYSVIDEKENSIYVVLGFSGLIFISNIIGIILNNIYEKYSWCDSNYMPSKDYKYEPANRENKNTSTPDNLDYNLEAEANRDPNDETPSNSDKSPMIEYQTYSSNDNIGKTVY